MSKEQSKHIQQRNQEVFDTTWIKFQEQQKEASPFAILKEAATTDFRNTKRVIRGLGQEIESQVEQLDPDKQKKFLASYAQERQRRLTEERRANGYLGWATRKGLISRNSDGVFNIDDISKLESFQENPHLLDIVRARQISQVTERTAQSDQHHYVHSHSGHENSQKGHDDHHEHHHVDAPPPITKKWQKWTVFGNAIIGATELAAGGTSNTLSVVIDGVHNAGDAGTYWLQTENILNANLNKEKQDTRRKLAHWLISVGSIALSIKAGIEISADQELTPDALDIFAALSSVGLNSVLYYKLRQGLKRNKREGIQTPHEKDLLKHFHAVDFPSAGLALFGAGTQAIGIPFVEPAAAVASGLIGAYAFRPTEKNLNHSHCAKHDHGHQHEHHEEEQIHEGHRTTPLSKRKKLRTAFAGLATVAVLGGGLAAAKTMTESVEIPTKPNKSYAAVLPEQVDEPLVKKKKQIEALTESIKIKKGDSQWVIVQQKIKDAGHVPTIPTTNIIVDLTADMNKKKIPHPDTIQANKILQVPTNAVMDVVINKLSPLSSSPITEKEKQLIEDLQSLNQQPDITKQELIKKEKKRLQRIKNFLQTHFSHN